MIPETLRPYRDQLLATALLKASLPRIADDPNRFIPFAFNLNQAELHRELQSCLTDHTHVIVELPRDHGKTTQVCGRILWELGRNNDLRIKIFCSTDVIARERVRFLREMISDNPRTKLVFPGLIPTQPWQEEQFTVRNLRTSAGPSVTAFGIGSNSTGTRADLLVCDDIVDSKSLMSDRHRERIRTEFNNNVMNLLESKGRYWGLCTPWHTDDLNATLKSNPAFHLFHRSIDDQLTPIWPEHWSREQLLARKVAIGDSAFARGYHLVSTVASEKAIQDEWIGFSDVVPESFDAKILSVDPAVALHDRADYTACVKLGIKDRVVYCLNAVQRRVPVGDMVAFIRGQFARDGTERIFIEANGGLRSIADLLISEPELGPFIDTHSSKVNKSYRIQTFGAHVKAGQFVLQTRDRDSALHRQMRSYPFLQHDDLIDAAAMGTQRLLSLFSTELKIRSIGEGIATP